ncbi:unnamed protein product [Microthlaspi erraticum]|uniref:Uncharacterized protein n=1 Tax=Microthlaspi erraticum TaxID=1685480 RepID=A0A6D2IPG5_9BRAS|nr:unnamed protein product [Microthlaspi erraticum]
MRTRPLNSGKWDDSLHYVVGDGVSKTKVSDPASNASLLWKRTKPPPNVIPKFCKNKDVNEGFSFLFHQCSLSLMHVHVCKLSYFSNSLTISDETQDIRDWGKSKP